jgi:hypothetical protein
MLDRPGYLQVPLIVTPIDGKHLNQLLTFQVSTPAAIFSWEVIMRIVYKKVAGLDVHRKLVVAATSVLEPDGRITQEKRNFETMTADLLGLSDWLMSHGITHVAIESTGEYWKPVSNILENNFEVLVVNDQHISKVPGRKTDQLDAEWISD